MSNAEAVRRTLQTWVHEAKSRGRLEPNAVPPQEVNELARSAAWITPSDVASRVPALEPFKDEVVELLRDVAGVDGAPTPPAEEPAEAQPRSWPSPNGGTPPAPPAQTPVAPVPDVPAEGLRVEPGSFAPYTGGVPGEASESVRVTISPGGQLVYSWPHSPQDGSVAVFRVITDDRARPLSPEDGRLVTVTDQASIQDDRPTQSVRRHVQVWLNIGTDLSDAMARQAVLWAESTTVAPVREAHAEWDHGAIIARWVVVPGVEKVRIFRIPGAEVESVLAHELDQYAVLPEMDNRHGVVDDGGHRGHDYVYRILTEAGGSWSPPVDIHVAVPHDDSGVEDLTATVERQPTQGSAGSVTLEWTQAQAAQVAIYRSPSSPPPGLVGRIVTRATLEATGLTRPVPNFPEPTDTPGRFRMRGVQWPAGWTSAYFIPVTLMGDEALAGRAAKTTGVPMPETPELSHRGPVQVLSFGWPEQVGTARVHLAPPGADPTQVVEVRPLVEVDRQSYIRQGGIRLALPTERSVDVVLTAWVTGQTRSEPVVVPVKSRFTVSYSMEPRRRLGIGAITHGRVVVWSEQSTGKPFPFVVVHNERRLPLHADDGEVLEIVPDDAPDATSERVLRPATLSGGPQGAAFRALASKRSKSGYVRLFVAPQVPAETRRRILVLDPPVGGLIWGAR